MNPIAETRMTSHPRATEHLSTLHVAYSFACGLSCAHCIFRCGPDVLRTMGLAAAKTYIDQAARVGIRKIVFTGGEPLFHPGELRGLIHHAATQGMQCALMTNAFWASSRNRTEVCLIELRDLGLQSITLSTDRYHLLAVPVENLQRALDVSGKIGLQVAVKIARLQHDPIAEGLCRDLCDSTTRILVQDISPLGRASSLRHAVRLRPSWTFTGPGCSTPPVLLPNGNLLTCCNLPARDLKVTDFPLVLGNIREESLATLLRRRSTDPLLNTLRSRGPSTVLTLLARHAPQTRVSKKAEYHSGCDLCFRLFCRTQDKRVLYAALENPFPLEHPGSGAAA